MQPADALSDGTLRFICLSALLGQPEVPGLIVLDEPELGLHPFAVERRDGAPVFDRPDPDRLSEWLEEYSLGELWEKNLLGGRPRPERG
jgi:hypothetical protein